MKTGQLKESVMAIETVRNPGLQSKEPEVVAPAKCSNSSHNGILKSQQAAQEALSQLEAYLPKLREAAQPRMQ
jgi:hypothetical protein